MAPYVDQFIVQTKNTTQIHVHHQISIYLDIYLFKQEKQVLWFTRYPL